MKDSNMSIEELAKQFEEDFHKYFEKDNRRMGDNGLITCVIYDDELWDCGLNKFRASFELRKKDIKDYVYVDKQKSLNFWCESGYEYYYLNRTYKFIRMERDSCAIFYRNY